MKVILQILPKIVCHGNVPWDIKKEVQIDHLYPKRFHSVKRLRKSVQRILRSFVSEKLLKKIQKKKKKEINACKIYRLSGNFAERAKK